MAFYIISIVGSDLLICLVNILVNKHFFNLSILYIVLACLLGAVGVIAIDGLIAFFIRRALPEKKFDYHNKRFAASKKECAFYDFLRIKDWKDRILELGVFTGFSKKSIYAPQDRAYVERFILECNYGSCIHLWNAIGGFLLIFAYPLKYIFCFGLPIACVNAFLSMLPFMVLRYNVNRLYRLRDILEKKENRSKSK